MGRVIELKTAVAGEDLDVMAEALSASRLAPH
jgi:hypothetical protein